MRLIDADALMKRLQGVLAMVEEEPNQTYANAIRHAMIDVKLSPTIDAEPVRRGRWIDLRESYKDVPHVRCSVCSNVIYGIEYVHKYCFRRGAKMDLEVQDDHTGSYPPA